MSEQLMDDTSKFRLFAYRTVHFQQAEQQTKSNPAHSTGSPGFLRGRGRGRPKLIGDELDAALVDYMVQASDYVSGN